MISLLHLPVVSEEDPRKPLKRYQMKSQLRDEHKHRDVSVCVCVFPYCDCPLKDVSMDPSVLCCPCTLKQNIIFNY